MLRDTGRESWVWQIMQRGHREGVDSFEYYFGWFIYQIYSSQKTNQTD